MSMEKLRGFFDWLERAKLLYDLLAVVVEWKTVKAALTHLTHIPPDVASAIAWGGAAIVIVLLHRFAYNPRRRSSSPVTSAASNALATAQKQDLDMNVVVDKLHKSDLGPEFEATVSTWIASIPERDRDKKLSTFISYGLISYLHDETWYLIFRSQILALQRLNGNPMTRDALKRDFYDPVVAKEPAFYKSYTFDQWLDFLYKRILVLTLPGDVVGITQRGKDFLKHIVHYGYSVDTLRFH